MIAKLRIFPITTKHLTEIILLCNYTMLLHAAISCLFAHRERKTGHTERFRTTNETNERNFLEQRIRRIKRIFLGHEDF